VASIEAGSGRGVLFIALNLNRHGRDVPRPRTSLPAGM
jgi:hypothetical protein